MRRHLFRVAALLAVAGVMTACTGSDSPGRSAEPTVRAPESGYKTVSAAGVSVDVPTAWVEKSTPATAGQDLMYGTKELSADVPVHSVSVVYAKVAWPDVESAAGAQASGTLTAIPGSRQTDRRDVTVPGAGRGLVTTITFPTLGGGRGTLYDLVAFGPDGRRLLVRVSTQDASALGTAQHVLGSVRLDG
jgi:hypothetical protein